MEVEVDECRREFAHRSEKDDQVQTHLRQSHESETNTTTQELHITAATQYSGTSMHAFVPRHPEQDDVEEHNNAGNDRCTQPDVKSNKKPASCSCSESHDTVRIVRNSTD